MTENEQKAYDWLTRNYDPLELRVLPPLYRRMKQISGIDVPYADFRSAVAWAIINDPEATDEQAAAEAEVLRKYGRAD